MRKLLEIFKNKWVEYLAEILVIIIGILIAFMLNNWNERRKELLDQESYLIRLKNDLVTDNLNLHELIEDQKAKIISINSYFQFYQSNKNDFDALKDSVLNIPLKYGRYFPTNHTQNELINTGDFDLIPEQIRGELLELSGVREGYQIKNDKIITDIKNQLVEVTKYWANVNFLEWDTNPLDFNRNGISPAQDSDGLRHFHHVINLHYGWAESIIGNYKQIIELNSTLIQSSELEVTK